jgi:hypothetical protein
MICQVNFVKLLEVLLGKNCQQLAKIHARTQLGIHVSPVDETRWMGEKIKNTEEFLMQMYKRE